MLRIIPSANDYERGNVLNLVARGSSWLSAVDPGSSHAVSSVAVATYIGNARKRRGKKTHRVAVKCTLKERPHPANCRGCNNAQEEMLGGKTRSSLNMVRQEGSSFRSTCPRSCDLQRQYVYNTRSLSRSNNCKRPKWKGRVSHPLPFSNSHPEQHFSRSLSPGPRCNNQLLSGNKFARIWGFLFLPTTPGH